MIYVESDVLYLRALDLGQEISGPCLPLRAPDSLILFLAAGPGVEDQAKRADSITNRMSRRIQMALLSRSLYRAIMSCSRWSES